jgi:chromosome segregation protein
MRLTTITISGFKSFSQKTVIDVRKNITGIVGPNGSGKSNIAEAIRFVLGEQSMKSMRTPEGSDLIFKGSGGRSGLPALSRASVSLTLSNKDKVYEPSERVAPYLVYDEIVLSREIYADSTSDYLINGAKVRLKDVEELLALAGIGNNKHAILNQGEADRVLLVSPRERRVLIEDALGLKVFQIRILETRRKLEKTHRHLAEVKALEKEARPHFEYLKRQIEKIKKVEVEKERFKEYAKYFFREEKQRLMQVKQALRETGSSQALQLLLETLEKDVKSLLAKGEEQAPKSVLSEKIAPLANEIASLEVDLREKSISLELVIRERAKLKREMEQVSESKTIILKEEDGLSFRSDIFNHIDGMREAYTEKEKGPSLIFLEHFERSKFSVNTLLYGDTNKKEKENEAERNRERELEVQEKLLSLEKEKLALVIDEKRKELRSLEEEKIEEKTSFIKEERKIYTMRTKSAELRGLVVAQKEKERSYEDDTYYFESLLEEAKVFLGVEVREYPYLLYEGSDTFFNRYEARKALEKSRLRLEEWTISSENEIEKEYKKAEERLSYLNKEIEDIVRSEKELEFLILEVESHMQKKYIEGIESVSKSFAKYFATVFPGGEASLVQKEDMIKEDDEVTKERGVEIMVKLPGKKVKSTFAFSGGEKALTSISLLFALSEVSPPPFIVLDETDAPLDEHNARKYGETLALLSEKSKLLVITHNRETMSHCEMLYGVTIGIDGASKLLSVDLK